MMMEAAFDKWALVVRRPGGELELGAGFYGTAAEARGAGLRLYGWQTFSDVLVARVTVNLETAELIVDHTKARPLSSVEA